ncbi:hypothetical protein FM107_05155 [Sphingobacterium sp. JB170]|nr:hypothetical protein FM107_05155 [Sphingobacterium sp. JB170]
MYTTIWIFIHGASKENCSLFVGIEIDDILHKKVYIYFHTLIL